MIVLFRHGETDYNEPPQRFRGNSDIPLTKGGRITVAETALDLKRLSERVGKPVLKVYSSDIKRAAQTADAITAETGVKNEETPKLRDWDYGDFTGKDVEDNLSEIKRYQDECPDVALPGGESYNSFLHRLIPFVNRAIDEDGDKGIVVLVTHNRVIRTILAWIAAGRRGDRIDREVLDQKKDPILPGHMRKLEVA